MVSRRTTRVILAIEKRSPFHDPKNSTALGFSLEYRDDVNGNCVRTVTNFSRRTGEG